MTMTLLHPWVLLLLPLPRLCRRFCRAPSGAEIFSNLPLLQTVAGSPLVSTRRLRALLYLLLLLALAGPALRHTTTVERIRSYEIGLLLDDSRSMEEDRRFDLARNSLERFIRSRSHDRLALLLFADYATLASPLTADHRGLLRVLSRLEPGMAGGRETALYEALWRGADLFDGTQKGPGRFLILLTDGLDTTGSLPLSAALARIREQGLRVYTIGVGDDYRREVLERIARESGGAFFDVRDPTALPRIFDEIDRRQKHTVSLERQVEIRPLWRWPATAALLLGFWLFWRLRRDRWERWRLGALLGLLGITLLVAGKGTGGDHSSSPPPLWIALDLSRSMDATDCPPSRLAVARSLASELLPLLPPSQPVGILGFARIPYLIAPPTRDRRALAELLERLDPGAIDREGTDMSAPLRALGTMATRSDRNASRPRAALLVLSDGGEAAAYPETARLLRSAALHLDGILLATERGGPIPARGGYLHTPGGGLVHSAANPAFARLVTRQGGRILRCPVAPAELEALAAGIARRLGSDRPAGKEPSDRPSPALWAALLLLLLPRSLGRKR
jgi:Ca-activated chloride channel family protein